MLLPLTVFWAMVVTIGLAVPSPAAEIVLQPGESLTLKPNRETTVTCSGPSAAVRDETQKARSQKCVSPGSEESCKGLNNGDLCRKEEIRGNCIGNETLHGLECKCIY